MSRRSAVVLAGGLLVAGSVGLGVGSSGAASTLCGTTAGPPPQRWDHVVLVVMENRSYRQIFTKYASDAPYINGTLKPQCGVATNYWALSDVSLPNYLALTAGSMYGVTSDVSPKTTQLTGPSLFSVLGSDWSAQLESMPSNCKLASSDLYSVHHNPPLYFSDLRSGCMSRDVPLVYSRICADGVNQCPDLSARFTLIVPNLTDSMHASPTTTTNEARVAAGDSWLASFVPALINTVEYQAGRTAVLITWDEGAAGDFHVPLIVVSPFTPAGATDGGAYTHYSLVRTMQEMLGLSPNDDPPVAYLNQAANATSLRPSNLGL